MAITGAKSCDLFLQNRMSIEGITCHSDFRKELESKLVAYYYDHFMTFMAIKVHLKTKIIMINIKQFVTEH